MYVMFAMEVCMHGWYGMLWCGMVWNGMIWYGMAWYVWDGMDGKVR